MHRLFCETGDTSMNVEGRDISNARLWTSRVLRSLVVTFLLIDGVMKLFKPAPVVEATLHLGYPESAIVGVGLTLLICTVLYVIPRTAVWGALCLTGYLGGAVATNVRASTPTFNIVFPIVFAVLIWAGLVVADTRLKSVLFESK
jgi:DoxX-like family